MGRIIEYKETSGTNNDDYFIIDGNTDGTRKLKAISAIKNKAYGCVLYIQNGGVVEWSESSPVMLDVGNNSLTFIIDNTSYVITPQDVLTAASTKGLTINGTSISGATYVIYFNMSTKTVDVVIGATSPDARTVITQNPVLFMGHYASMRSGMIVDYVTRKKHVELVSNVEENTSDIQELKSVITDADVIPDYFKTQLDNKIPTIISNMNEAGPDGVSFVFITDLHWETNYKKSPALVKYVLDKTSIKNVICGGDIINQGEKDAMSETFLDCINRFRFVANDGFFPIARGNHDDNSNWTSADDIATYAFDSNTIYNLLYSQIAERAVRIHATNWTFYFDQTATKTRFIFADTKRNGSTVDVAQIVSCLNTVSAGWHVIIVPHFTLRDATTLFAGTDMLGHIARAYNNRESGSYTGSYQTTTYDFTNAVGKVDLIIGGHMHLDLAMAYDDANNPSGIPIVATDTDSYRTASAVENTVTSQCFDVITVDYTAKTIKCVRIGRGSDRLFAY